MRLFIALVVTMFLNTIVIHASDLTREETERFLMEAEIVSVKEVGSGATKPLKVMLEKDGVQQKAIFKAIDVKMDGPAHFGGQTVSEYSDSYKHELAAYELDKMLGLNLLPVIVAREVNGQMGSLREWVSDVMPRYGHGQVPPDPDVTRDQAHLIWLFDYLIYNVDRRTHNLMVDSEWTPILIDHSMSFALFDKPVRPLYRFPKETVVALRQIGAQEFENRLRPYLRDEQIETFLMRREYVLNQVDSLVAVVSDEELFFDIDSVK